MLRYTDTFRIQIASIKDFRPTLTKAIKKIDSKAFVSVSAVSSVYGQGFDEMKTGIERKKKTVGSLNQ